MDYMTDKIDLHPKKEEIVKIADKIVKILKDNEKLNDSERLLAMELAVAKVNFDLYNISGDN